MAVVGPNGSGKSTLLRVLAGADTALDGGEVQVRKGCRVGFLPQEPQFPEDATALEARTRFLPRKREKPTDEAQELPFPCLSLSLLRACPSLGQLCSFFKGTHIFGAACEPQPARAPAARRRQSSGPSDVSFNHSALSLSAPDIRQALLATDHPKVSALRAYRAAAAAAERDPSDSALALALADAAHGMDEADAWATESAVETALDELGCRAFADRRCGALSGGQTKRLALASVLLQEPELLILDEPTNHLSVQGVEWLESKLADPSLTVLMARAQSLSRVVRATTTAVSCVPRATQHST